MYVYLLKSISNPREIYIGITNNLKNRIKIHNSKKVPHTSKFVPWKIKVAIWFEDKEKAITFEKYLKHGSGSAFAKKHLW
jgi:predicted GIY-YIG superfamily endonuclease